MSESGRRASLSPFDVPTPYGRAAGVDALSSVAAPLLAGGALAMAGVVIQQENALRHPGLVLILLVAAVVALVTAVQFGSWARQYAVSPDELLQWWPDANAARREIVHREQHRSAARHRVWAQRFSVCFNAGIFLLWLALGVAVMPKAGVQEPGWRWAATALALFGVAAEVVWLALSSLAKRSDRVAGWLSGSDTLPPDQG